MNGSDIHRMVYDNIAREQVLINNRISWAITMSGGLLAASAIFTNIIVLLITQPESYRYVGIGFILLFMALLSVFGIWFSSAVQQAVLSAYRQIDYLKGEYDKFEGMRFFMLKSHDRFPKLEDKQLESEITSTGISLPRPFAVNPIHTSGRSAAMRFPLAMIVIWSLVCALEVCFSVAVFTLHFARSAGG
jgi:hypothetical protein